MSAFAALPPINIHHRHNIVRRFRSINFGFAAVGFGSILIFIRSPQIVFKAEKKLAVSGRRGAVYKIIFSAAFYVLIILVVRVGSAFKIVAFLTWVKI